MLRRRRKSVRIAGNPAALGTAISIGTALLAGCLGMWAAMRSRTGGAVHRDTAVSILFGIAVVLIGLNVMAGALIAVAGMAYEGVLEAVLLLTAAFAVAGIVCGLLRGLRRGRAIKTQNA